MKIVILSRNPKLYSTRRLVEAAKEREYESLSYEIEKLKRELGSDD